MGQAFEDLARSPRAIIKEDSSWKSIADPVSSFVGVLIAVRDNAVRPFDTRSTKGFTGQGSFCVTALDSRFVNPEVQEQVEVAITIHVSEVRGRVCRRRSVGSEPHSCRVNGLGVEVIGWENGDGQQLFIITVVTITVLSITVVILSMSRSMTLGNRGA